MKSKKHILLLSAFAFFACQFGHAQGDNPEPTIVSIGSLSTINCLSSNQEIGVSINAWVPGFNYQWNTGENDSIISVKPAQTTTYFLQITNAALGISELRGFEVRIENDPIKITEANYHLDNTTCKGTELNIEPAFSGGYAPYTFVWDNGINTRSQQLFPQESVEHKVTITDACGSQSTSIIRIVVDEHDPVIPASTKVYEFECPNQLVTIKPNLSEVIGGIGSGYQYSFDNWLTYNQPLEIEAENDLKVNVQFTDGCGQQIVSSKIQFVQIPMETIVLDEIAACENEVVNITSSDSEQSFFYWDGNLMSPSHEIVVTKNEVVTLTYLDKCGDAHRIDRDIELIEIESEFDYDAHESIGMVELFTTNNGQDLTYDWIVNGNSVGTTASLEIDLEPGSTNEVELITMNKNGCVAKTTRTVSVRDNYSVPSAFSPNNDGKNDFFRLNIDEEFTDFKVEIFDRWGQLIYHSNDQYFAWEGEEQTTGILNTYVYKIKGTAIGGGNVEKTGTLTVVN